ncbi:MAG: hypothetical protein V2A34_16575 [Lentisphaerota bacterium]
MVLGGCTTPPGFMADRGRDTADVFTFSTGLGGGAKVRLGPLQCGLLYDSTLLGLRGGEWMTSGNFTNDYSSPTLQFLNIQQKAPDILDTQMIITGSESFYNFPRAARRGKTFSADTTLLITTPSPKTGRGNSGETGGKYPASYFTQIEAVLACGAGFRIGFNPGELLDFLLGWGSIDIYGDDLNAAPATPNPTP